MRDRPIGVFDSGVGGLTVVKELIRELPYEDIIYFGDTARVPYGVKSKETIIRFSIENILFLLKNDVKLICIACNTVSSLALPVIKGHFRIPIVGVISPGAKEAVYVTKNNRVGVIGTRATIKSQAYEKEIKTIDSSIKTFTQSCPLFVPFVEEGWIRERAVLDIASRYLKPLREAKVDTLILGCTHYPLLKGVIQEVMGKNVQLIDSAVQVAREVKTVLAEENCLNTKKRRSSQKFYVSDETSTFFDLGKSFLGKKIIQVEKINNV